jgi:hypothetical protein
VLGAQAPTAPLPLRAQVYITRQWHSRAQVLISDVPVLPWSVRGCCPHCAAHALPSCSACPGRRHRGSGPARLAQGATPAGGLPLLQQELARLRLPPAYVLPLAIPAPVQLGHHLLFPEPFKASVRALLLVHHRLGSTPAAADSPATPGDVLGSSRPRRKCASYPWRAGPAAEAAAAAARAGMARLGGLPLELVGGCLRGGRGGGLGSLGSLLRDCLQPAAGSQLLAASCLQPAAGCQLLQRALQVTSGLAAPPGAGSPLAP